jgi:DNA-binding winged helix-turn-helix (wHTH) protein
MHYVFGDCTLDTQLYVLHRAGRPLPLRAKVFQVLHYLLAHRGRVISKRELCEQVWSDQFVSDAALEGVIKAVRRAVGDDGRAQWCIQTRRGQGYRFVAPVTMAAPPPAAREEWSPSSPSAGTHFRTAPVPTGQPPLLVGREAELAGLHQWWGLACQGTRQVGFVTGEAGVGKTALVEAFVDGLGPEERPWVGYGQCLEPYGAGEAYLPLLEALGRLCRGGDGGSLLAMLRQHAPSWLVQMPTLLPPAERDALQRLANGVTPARMM